MRLDKLTTKSQEALEAAQELAHQHSQQQVDGEHLALALARQQDGIIPTLLNFGTVRAQTASAFESNFKTNGLPDPRGLQGIVQKAMDDRLTRPQSDPNRSDMT